MSDKATHALDPLDVFLRETVHATAPHTGLGEDGTLLQVEFISGFELFNTRRYHNYESWGSGYRITGRGVTVEREDLDDALVDFFAQVWEAHVAEPERPDIDQADAAGLT